MIKASVEIIIHFNPDKNMLILPVVDLSLLQERSHPVNQKSINQFLEKLEEWSSAINFSIMSDIPVIMSKESTASAKGLH